MIENQGGGGGTIAASAVARAKPDGYTLLAGTTSELVISPVIMSHPLVRSGQGPRAGRHNRGVDLGADGA